MIRRGLVRRDARFLCRRRYHGPAHIPLRPHARAPSLLTPTTDQSRPVRLARGSDKGV